MEGLKGNYDVVVCGTGLTETLVSGALCQAGKHLVHFDKYDYGGCRISKGLNDFINWVTENGEIIVNKCEEKLGTPIRNAAYAFDLMPMTMYSHDDLIQVLIDTKNFECVYLYLIDGLYYRTKDSFHSIPCSKSSIFQDKSIPMRQKRAVMKFISYFFPEAEFGHLTDTEEIQRKVEEFNDKPFKDLLTDLGFNEDLNGAFEYFIALAPKPLLTKEAVPRIRYFCKSFGIYGASSLLGSAYGSSELPQLFARHTAVYGGIYVLHHYPETVKAVNDSIELEVNEIGKITTSILITSPIYLPSTGKTKLIAYREVLLLTSPMFEQYHSVAVIPPNVMGNEKPVYIHQFDSSMKYCEKGQYIIHVSAMCEIRNIVDELLKELPEDSIVLRTSFVLTEPVAEVDGNGIYVVPSPSLDELVFGTNYFLSQAKEIMKRIDPTIPFYPKPTEVEVFIDEEEPAKEEKKEETKEEKKEEKEENEEEKKEE
ncbi:rab escort protein [Histomonas meleagridis]|uniref:rab escort protein n=1 Tax=Histomonas meleagridis TaxID=135588 RepID=UPI003559EE75|nr:rab escort protein [Histomonas meleagridis]KAH0804702.1 rab escort protein [Histomonas meleagridis]